MSTHYKGNTIYNDWKILYYNGTKGFYFLALKSSKPREILNIEYWILYVVRRSDMVVFAEVRALTWQLLDFVSWQLERCSSSVSQLTKTNKSEFAMADKAKLDLGLLEEDDEFEEFPAESMQRSLFH